MKLSPLLRACLSSFAVVPLLAIHVDAQEPSRESDASTSPAQRPPLPPATSGQRVAESRRVGPELPDVSSVVSSIENLGRDRVHYDEPGDGNVWARGADYKASFGADGAVFYPRLGPRAPRNVPHALSPDLVTIDGAPISFTRGARAIRTGDRVELDRGAFVEAYDVRPGSIEQTFVFATLPARGEIVVHIPVASEFEGRAMEDGLEFRGELGAVRYSRAVAVDALGRRRDMRTGLVDGAIEIVVDADFVRTAALPLVVDPSVFTVDAGAQDNSAADVAWNQNHFGWITVFEEVYSATDRDLRAWFLSYPGVPVRDLYLDFTVSDCVGPRCANLNAYEQCLVVFTVNGPVPRVFGREVDMVGFGAGAWITIAENAQAAVVGGDPYPTPGSAAYYCVAYERTVSGATNVRSRLVRPDGTLVGASDTPIAAFPGQDHRAPAISKSNGGTEWMIAWERRDSASQLSEVWGARVRWNGDVSATAFPIATSLAFDPRPSVSSPLAGRDEYLVAYQQPVPGQGSHEIRAAHLDGSIVASTLNVTAAEGVTTPRDVFDACVDTDGSHFLIVYAESSPGTNSRIRSAELGLSAGTLAMVRPYWGVSFGTAAARRPRAAGLRPQGETSPTLQREYLLVWDAVSTGGSGDIIGGVAQGVIGGARQPICLGDGSWAPCPCGNESSAVYQAGCQNSFGFGSRLVAIGNASTTEDSIALSAWELPPNAPAPTFFQGTTTSTASFGDGLRCAAGAVVRLGPVAYEAGVWGLGAGFPGTPPVSVAGAIPPAGATRYYQAVYRNAASFCTPNTFNTTSGYRIVWMP